MSHHIDLRGWAGIYISLDEPLPVTVRYAQASQSQFTFFFGDDKAFRVSPGPFAAWHFAWHHTLIHPVRSQLTGIVDLTEGGPLATTAKLYLYPLNKPSIEIANFKCNLTQPGGHVTLITMPGVAEGNFRLYLKVEGGAQQIWGEIHCVTPHHSYDGCYYLCPVTPP